jgi:OmpA-OmpF porin, OOP family
MRRWLLAASMVLSGPLAHAAEHGFYFGAGVNRNEIDEIAAGPLRRLELEETEWKAIVGIRPFDFLAAELTYMDLGKGSGPAVDATTEATALSASVIGLLPLRLVEVFGKAGIARWELDSFPGSPCVQPVLCLMLLVPPRLDSGSDVVYGAGAQLKLKRVAIRLEYEKFDIDDTDGAELYTLGFTRTF